MHSEDAWIGLVEPCDEPSCVHLCIVHVAAGFVMVRCQTSREEAFRFLVHLATTLRCPVHSAARALFDPTGMSRVSSDEPG